MRAARGRSHEISHMGSGQSRPASGSELPTTSVASDVPSSDPPPAVAAAATENDAKTRRSKASRPTNESGYQRAERVCRRKKRAYDACYTAQLSSKDEDCAELFESYRACFLRVMTRDMERRGVKVSENSMVGEFTEEEREEDDDR